MTPYFIISRTFRQDLRVDSAAVRHFNATRPREAAGIAGDSLTEKSLAWHASGQGGASCLHRMKIFLKRLSQKSIETTSFGISH